MHIAAFARAALQAQLHSNSTDAVYLQMQKILVTGANGLLGQHLVKSLVQEGYQVVATGKGPNRLPPEITNAIAYYSLDITDDALTHQLIETVRPYSIIHAAALTQVDYCQLHQDQCEAVNVRATAQLLLSAEQYCRRFIYVSTDFVFDGEKGNYVEDDPTNPVNWYGSTKVQAESIVAAGSLSYAIARTCLVYGHSLSGTRSNLISWVKENLEAGKGIQVVDDQWRTPTAVEDLAKGLLLIINTDATGTYHIAGSDILTPHAMALQTASACGLDPSLIKAVNASTFQQPAKRPPKTGFNITKAATTLGYQPMSFDERLRRMLGNG